MKLEDFLPDYLYSANGKLKINKNKNSIIFGSNGIGKTSIYSNIKKEKGDIYHFLDYDDTKKSFEKNENNLIIASNLIEINFIMISNLIQWYNFINIKNKVE